MKTQHGTRAKHEVAQDQSRPSPEPTEWKKAPPPQLVGKNPSRVGEWRPGEAAKRGYEKAVEDWWWL